MERHSLRRFYGRQIFKGALFASTALVLPAIAPRVALAQLSPNATPTGGVVVGGSASIAQAPASTTVTQASQLAAINWQSFNVGAAAKVQFNQPNASAVALNRVTGGNLSQINGQINANGQIVLINQSGVVFGKGSQVNAESVVVSTSDIATSDFMAGRMNFTGAPHPGAKIINDGNITARSAGLVGLVAPQVANNGVITAQLGQVVLAGASAFTLDLYGDRLISLDVTQAVRAVDVNGQLVPALVTNSGVILADGGKVTLTAQDADALVTQLITAGGTIRANNVGNQTGAISVTGVGGNISIAGNLLAQGTTPGAKGGAIQALATGTVTVAPTAVIDASGNAGGGYAAIGTTLARAQTGPSDAAAPAAAAVTIAQGASIRADATAIGNGGTITVLSQNTTSFQGALSAQGGPQGGNGGLAEISSHGVINLGGTVDNLAINGKPGEILLDPATITIVTGGGASTTGSQIAPSYLDSLSGNIVISASSLLEVLSDVRMSVASTALTLQSGQNISIDAFISVNGSLEIDAGNSIFIGPGTSVGTDGHVTFTDTGGIIANNALFSAASGIDIGAAVKIAPGALTLESPGGAIIESSATGFLGTPGATVSGFIQTGTVTGNLGSVGGNLLLNNPGNAIDTLVNFSTVNGTIDIADAAALSLMGEFDASAATFASGGNISVLSFVSIANSLEIDAAGDIYVGPSFSGAGTIFSAIGRIDAGSAFLSANSAGGIDIGGVIAIATGGAIELESPSGPITESTFVGQLGSAATTISGFLQTSTLAGDGGTIGGSLLLNNPDNAIDQLINLGTVDGAITVDDAAPFILAGKAFASAATFASSGDIDIEGFVSVAGSLEIDTAGAIYVGPSFAVNGSDTIFSSTGGLAAGNALLSANSAGGINIGADVQIAAAGTIALESPHGPIFESQISGTGSSTLVTVTGLIQAVTLTGDGSQTGGNLFLTNTANAIGTIENFSTVNGTITINDAASLDVPNALIGSNIFINIAAGQALSFGPGSAGLTANTAGGIVSVTADTLNNQGVNSFLAPAGTIQIAPATPTEPIYLNAIRPPVSPGLVLVSTDFQGAQTVIFGNSQNTGGISVGGLGNQNFGGETVELLTQGAAAQTQMLTAGTLEIFAGSFGEVLGGAVTVSTLLGTVGGAFDLFDAGNTIGTIGALIAGTSIDLANDIATDLVIAGQVSAGSNIELLINAGGLTENGGAIDTGATGTLTGNIGGFANLSGHNAIQNIGPFAATGGILLQNFGPLGITGDLNANGTLALQGGGTISESSAGFVLATTLTSDGSGFAGNINLNNALNNIGTISNLVLGTGDAFNLLDGHALNVDGPLKAANITLSAPQITLASDVSATALLELIAASAISQTAGSITAGTLAGSLTTGDISLAAAANSFGTLGGLSADTGNIFLADTAPIQIIGAVDAHKGLYLTLASLTALSETSTGIIAAATLDNVSQLSGFTLANPGNNIGTLIGDYIIASGGAFALFDTQPIQLATTIAAAGVSFGGAGVTEITGGLIDTPTLGGAGQITGSIILTNNNSIDNIAGLTLTGTLDVNDITNVDLSLIAAQTATLQNPNSLGLVNIGGFVSVAGAFDFAYPEGSLAGTGSLAAATLLSSTGSIAYVDLPGGNSIATLAGLADSGNFDLNDLVTLNIAGELTAQNILLGAPTILLNNPVEAAFAGTLAVITNNVIAGPSGDFSVFLGTFEIASQTASEVDVGGTSAAGILGLPGTIFPLSASEIIIGDALGFQAQSIVIDSGTFGTGLLILSATRGITDNGPLIAGDLEFDGGGFIQAGPSAAITANILSADAPVTGLVSLASTLNNIGALGPITVTSADLIVTDGGALTVGGTLNANDIALSDASGISITAAIVAATAGTIQLAAPALSATPTATISAPSGTVIISPYAAATPIDLGGTSHGGLTLADQLLDIIGAGILRIGILGGGEIVAEGSVAITEPELILTGSSIDFTGALNGGANLLSLASAGNISESPGAVLTFATILGAGGAVGLGGQNTFGTIGNFAATGDLLIDVFASTVIAGIISSPDTISLAGSFYTETANGGLQAAALASSGSIGGNVFLESTLNKIGSLAGFAVGAGDTFALNDNAEPGGLVITGPFTAPTATLSAASLQFAGNVAATILALQTPGDITQSAGTIAAATLTSLGAIGGNVTLARQNAIASLDEFTIATGHSLSLTDATALTLAGTDLAPIATLAAAGITFAGTFDAATELALAGNGPGAVTETTGAINTGTLLGAGLISGAVSLLNANSFGTLGALAATGNIALADTGALAITGQVSTTGTISLQATGDVTELTGGALDAAALTTGAGSIGGSAFLTSANSIATLENFTIAAGATLALLDSGLLTVAGTVFAPTATLSAGALAFTGVMQTPGLLALASAGTISQTAGTIAAGTLTSASPIGGNVFLLGANTIATLGTFAVASPNTFALDNTNLLTVTGPLTADNISLSSGAIAIAGAITATSLNLAATGDVTETSGIIDAATLTTGAGQITGTLSLANQNSIASLGPLTALGGILLNDQHPLDIAGQVTTANAITFEGTGDISESTGAIAAATLNTGSGTVAGNVQLGNANTIGVLGNTTLAAGDTFYLNDTGLLTVTGTLFAPTATLGTGSLSIQGALDGTYLALAAAGTIAEAGGTIAVATLATSGTAGGAIMLLGGNAIGTLSAFAGAADIALFDSQNLTIDGPVSTPATLTLEGPGSITEVAGGAITAATLTSAGTTIGGNLLLINANTIGALGALTLAPNTTLALTDTGLLTIAGTVAVPTVTLSAPTIALAGALNAPALALESAGDVYETGTGTIATDALSTGADSIAGFLSLQNANLIGATGNIDVLGDILLYDGKNLAIDGLVSTLQTLTLEGTSDISEGPSGLIDATALTTGGSILTGNIALNNQNSIATLANASLAAGDTLALTDTEILTLAGSIDIPFNTYTAPGIVADGIINAGSILALTGVASVTEGAGGGITAETLTSLGSVDGNILLGGAANTIGTVQNFTVGATNTFALTDTGLLTIAGPLAGATITLDVPTIAIPGSIIATELSFEGGDGGITETTGRIKAAILDSGQTTIGGALILLGANTIATIGDLSLKGNFALANNGPLAITGSLITPTGDVTFEDNADIKETGGGVITAAGLDTGGTTLGGNLLLENNNSIATLHGITLATGTFALTDKHPLNIAGTIFAHVATLTANALTIAGAIDGASLTLLNDGAVSETTGTISEATLTTGAGTIASLTFLQHNNIGTIGPLAATGDIAIYDINGPAIAGLVTTPGDLSLGGGAPSETSTGIIKTAELSSIGSLTGNASLGNTANAIASLGNFAGNGGLFLADASPLAITGLVQLSTFLGLNDQSSVSETGNGAIITPLLTTDNGAIAGGASLTGPNTIGLISNFAAASLTLTDDTSLLFDFGINIAGSLVLQDIGDVTQAGGTITAATLSTGDGFIGGNASFQNANNIATLAAFATQGALLLDDATPLAITGLVQAGAGVSLFDNSNIIETGAGAIIAPTFSGAVAGNAALTGANTIGLLATFSAASLTLTDNTPLDMDGPISIAGSLSLQDTGAVLQTGGYIDAAVLTTGTGQIGGDASFTQADNNILNLGDFTVAAGDLAINGVQNITGIVTATNALIVGGGNAGLTLSGNIRASNNVDLESGGSFYETPTGALTASNAYINVSNTNPAYASARLGGFNSVANLFHVVTGGPFTQTGGFIDGQNIQIFDQTGDLTQLSGAAMNGADIALTDSGAGANLALAGMVAATAALNLTSNGDLTDNAENLYAGSASFQGVKILLGGNNTINGALNVTGTGPGYGIELTGTVLTNTASLAANNSGGGILLAGNLTATGQLNLTAASFIDQTSGEIIAPTATLQAIQGNINLDGGGKITDTLDLIAPHGNIMRTDATGILSAGTLIGSATSIASFISATDIATLGSFILTDSVFVLDNLGSLTIIGPVVASAISITAAGALTLDGSPTGGLFIKGGNDPKTQLTPNSTDSVLEVTQPKGGGIPEIIQNGAFFINAGPEASNFPSFASHAGTVFFIGMPNADITFAQAPPDNTGLYAPSISIDLNVGPGGTGTGNANVYSLNILSGASIEMTGAIDGVSGSAGAGKGTAQPFPKPAYQFNACPIGSVNCVIIPIETIPSNNPLQNFDIDQRKRKRLDKNVALPGVAIRDF